MKVDKNLKDQMLFIKKFVTEPRTIGSVPRSAPQRVDSRLQSADGAKRGAVAELGAGTGVMTRAIIERKAKECELLVFEIEEELRKNLEDETGLEIYADARTLLEVMEARGIEKAGLIVSSLPFTVLPRDVTKSVMEGVTRSLAPDGSFVAFQYSLPMKGTLEKLFDKVDVRFVMMNIPSAFVYECRGVMER